MTYNNKSLKIESEYGILLHRDIITYMTERKDTMWNPDKSVVLSSICTKIAIGLVVVSVIVMPGWLPAFAGYTGNDTEVVRSLLVTFYACAVPGFMSLLCLNRLLVNIRRGEVFAAKNVRLLRALSWCSFLVAAILFISGFYYVVFMFVAIAAALLGLILRVIKNVFEQAIVIKQENDYTI